MKESHKSGHPKGYLSQLEDKLDLYFNKKAPALPKGGREFIVMIAPWLVIVGAVFSIPAILSLFGFGAIMSTVEYGTVMSQVFGPGYYISVVLMIVVVVLEVMALPGLFAKTKKGWDFIFYASLVSLLSSLISMNLGAFIIGGLISFYLLFQVRGYYK